jgi:Na+-translocating ferredoxin:NAD+ oxidoreductase RnfD subunit
VRLIAVTSPKSRLLVFLSLGAFIIGIIESDPRFIISVGFAAAVAAAADLALTRIRLKRVIFPESALVSGCIIGYVLSSGQPLWIVAAAAVLSMLSKNLVRRAGKHIFNPAAVGICSVIVLFHATTQWKATYVWWILLPLGGYLTYKIRKLQVLAGYAVVTMLLWGAQTLLQHEPLARVFGYLSYFFIFVMLIEPKTSPAAAKDKYLFGAGAAFLIFLLTLAGARFDVELLSLLIMNVFSAYVHIPQRKGAQ